MYDLSQNLHSLYQILLISTERFRNKRKTKSKDKLAGGGGGDTLAGVGAVNTDHKAGPVL